MGEKLSPAERRCMKCAWYRPLVAGRGGKCMDPAKPLLRARNGRMVREWTDRDSTCGNWEARSVPQ